MPPQPDAHTLIVGQGLAGSFLALALTERGQRVRVADPGHQRAASGVAAGLINPITGQRLNRAGDLETQLPAARERLQSVARLLGRAVHRDTPILRHLVGDRPQSAWPRRQQDPAYDAYLAPGPEADTVWIHGGAVVDTEALLAGVRAWLIDQGALLAEAVEPATVAVDATGVRWGGRRFEQVVFCVGAGAGTDPWFPDLPLRPIKGQVLEGTAADLPDHPIHRRKTLVPLGGERFRVGATYDREEHDAEPSAAARQLLAEALEGLLPEPDRATITRHLAGVRPGSPDGLPLLGRHPAQPRVAVFNGLGSKGLLHGPYFAEGLAAALTGGGPVPAEAAWDRFGAGA